MSEKDTTQKEVAPSSRQRNRLSFFLANFFNFFMFLWITSLIGGSALTGKTEGTKYFVGDHGRYVQVSNVIFTFGKIQGLFVCVMQIPALVCIVLAFKQKTTSRLWDVKFSRWNWLFILGLPALWLLAFVWVRFAEG